MDNSQKLDIYREMLLVRKFEEAASDMYEKGKVRGFLHLYIGQEAVATGFIAPIRSGDYVIAAYRDHGQAIARCADPRRVMAELFGKSDGVCGGKGGSMHMFDKDRRFLGGTGIVGGGMPSAVGLAFAAKYLNTDDICLCFFGDGAVNEGAFHESLNLAALWQLPVLFICENNLYGMGTAVGRASAVPNLYKRAQCYAMQVESVDGMDVEAVYDMAEKCINSVREKKQPVFVEASTYRFRGHSMSDPGGYRSKEEIEEWKKRDPIINFETKLIAQGLLNDETIKKIANDIEQQIKEAVEFAEVSPKPKPEDLYKHVYA